MSISRTRSDVSRFKSTYSVNRSLSARNIWDVPTNSKMGVTLPHYRETGERVTESGSNEGLSLAKEGMKQTEVHGKTGRKPRTEPRIRS